MSTTVTPEYEAAVTKLADEKVNLRFLNDSHDHAKLLANLMIGRASEDDEVLIYSKSLPASCFGEAFRNTKSKNIRIVLDDAAAVDGMSKLLDGANARVEHHVLQEEDGAHFFVVGNAFRLEIDHDKAKAIANFNEEADIPALRERFEKIWALSTQASAKVSSQESEPATAQAGG